jgi:hypothetical protein
MEMVVPGPLDSIVFRGNEKATLFFANLVTIQMHHLLTQEWLE